MPMSVGGQYPSSKISRRAGVVLLLDVGGVEVELELWPLEELLEVPLELDDEEVPDEDEEVPLELEEEEPE